MKERFTELAEFYRDKLLNDTIPFWEKNSIDRDCGGFFTCLERDGTVYDTDKFMWLQPRQAWTFAMLYNRYEKRDEWLEIARHGIDFVTKYGRDEAGDWFFRLTREGKPVLHPYNPNSTALFSTIAYAEYAAITQDEEDIARARETYDYLISDRPKPYTRFAKAYPGTRPLIGLGEPMFRAHVSYEIKWLMDADELNQTIDECLNAVFDKFPDPKHGIFRENVAPDGSFVDSLEGRHINPGHGIECVWFLMEVAEFRNNTEAIKKCVDVLLSTLDFAWDKEYGGIYNFMDVEGHPHHDLGWNQKLWWPHDEILIALSMAYRLTGNQTCWGWYEKAHEYCWNHFSDPEYGEWYGYLDRRSEVYMPLKGGKWKGCYHHPRMLYKCMREFEKLGSS